MKSGMQCLNIPLEKSRNCSTENRHSASRSRVMRLLLNKARGRIGLPQPERVMRIKKLKDQVRSGAYRVDPEKVADAMLRDLLMDL